VEELGWRGPDRHESPENDADRDAGRERRTPGELAGPALPRRKPAREEWAEVLGDRPRLGTEPVSARSITSRRDEVRNGSSPKYVEPGKCGRITNSVTRVRFRKESATRQTPFPTTSRRVEIGIGSAEVPQFSCQFRFAV
jgi:hypothetical protein